MTNRYLPSFMVAGVSVSLMLTPFILCAALVSWCLQFMWKNNCNECLESSYGIVIDSYMYFNELNFKRGFFELLLYSRSIICTVMDLPTLSYDFRMSRSVKLTDISRWIYCLPRLFWRWWLEWVVHMATCCIDVNSLFCR